MSLSLDIIRQLPKADLHCHLDGCCRPETIIELAHEQGVKLPTEDINELRKILTAPPDCPDLVTYLRCFDAPLDVMQYPYAITRIFYEVCEDAVKDGVTYLELRFAPALLTRKGLSYTQILQAAVDGVQMAQSKLQITVRIICCAMRMMTPEVNKEVSDIAWRFRNLGVVGFDLAGSENGFPPHWHIDAFRTMRHKAIPVTIHAGEAYGPKSIQYALDCNATRIGHGTRIVESEPLLQEVIDRRVTLECCVSSNVQTKAIAKLEDHPIKKLFERGVITVPCTDNCTVSGVTLSGEYFLLQNKFGFNVEELVRMMDYGFRSAFVDETLKRRLRIEAITKTLRVLRENNIDVTPLMNNALYYAPIGIFLPEPFKLPAPYPQVTLDLVKSLTKADTDTRLIGSIPLKTLFKFFKELPPQKKVKEFADFNEFEQFLMDPEDTNHEVAKRYVVSLLRTKENIIEGTCKILENAIEDNVKYIEITVAPQRHTKDGLKEQDVIDAIAESIKKYEGKIVAKIVLGVNIAKDSPIIAMKIAELCVNNKGIVAGFATNSTEIEEENAHFYDEVFQYLRRNYISVSCFAGEKHASSVQVAIVSANARRIAGGFKLTENDAILKEIASTQMDVIVKPSARFSLATAPIFGQKNVRSLYDFGVKVAYASLHGAFDGKSRSEELLQMCKEQGFGAIELVMILNNGFCSIFQHYNKLKELQNNFWSHTLEVLKARGYTRFINPTYFIQ
ncbi:adenosine deaminase family protein [Trichomonas vaginalis G3]|uniref:adenosine deaminase n=1 Tax=Trichomonas vaginalis (strain ATCC PRA-98 / G3) TaxID=412133 RepID=A2EQP3_TRIV3|nr:adenosine deaminase family [Trichomonas vaginalis G3]EAY05008.1 adenosine deaminase family protein [Trichomonas vaginalis G3]KAI5502968.1 adenosine deaminase family [Trichomonas vaginalis G3]|eukprot:XP_001317231.1 adenosine deaminase family protein [Trichomonas vaginalis G3]